MLILELACRFGYRRRLVSQEGPMQLQVQTAKNEVQVLNNDVNDWEIYVHSVLHIPCCDFSNCKLFPVLE